MREPVVRPQPRTQWTRDISPPLRQFLRTESVSAAVLVSAIGAGLIWANIAPASYASFWDTIFSIQLGSAGVSLDLRTWINSGLMAVFFLVVGLEARREIDLGELRDRRRFLLPLLVGVLGMALSVMIYLAATIGRTGADGWGVAMSTDTALALGLLAIVGRRVPDQMRAFLLTVFVVDDLVAIVVIIVAYSNDIAVLPLVVAAVAFAVFVAGLVLRIDVPAAYVLLGVIMWAAMLESGIDPVVTGLAIGLIAWAYAPTRGDLEQATGLVRLFREQPTPELAWMATTGLISTLSPNARLQRVYHPWTSFVIVPLFGLANAGIEINKRVLSEAVTSPVVLGILLGFVAGKPLGIAGTSWLVARVTGNRISAPVGWAAVLGGGTISGIGFTVSLLIAAMAFDGQLLVEAKFGVLAAALISSLLTWTVFRVISGLSPARSARALYGNAQRIIDLAAPVDAERDHIRGPATAAVTVVEYGDFECPYCGQAEAAVRELMDADVRFVWRHLPLTDVHPRAQLAAEAAEAAAAQGVFWPMHDLLLTRQDQLKVTDLVRYAEELGLDRTRFADDLNRRVHAARIAQDVESADLSGVSGTPTFFINGQRIYGAFDPKEVTAAIDAAHARAMTASLPPSRRRKPSKPRKIARRMRTRSGRQSK